MCVTARCRSTAGARRFRQRVDLALPWNDLKPAIEVVVNYRTSSPGLTSRPRCKTDHTVRFFCLRKSYTGGNS